MSLPRVAVIGGGGTGAALLHDLSSRGFSAVLFERGEVTSGTTGRHHGQLHSGARYAVRDRVIARECMQETLILRKIAPQALEMNYGLFIALTDADLAYTPDFIEACQEAGIPAKTVPLERAFQMEPNLSPDVKLAVQVPDGTIDAYRLPLHFLAAAKRRGGRVRTFCEVTEILRNDGRIQGLKYLDYRTGKESTHECDWIISAAGPWAGKVAALAGISAPVTPSPGTMVAVKGRLCNMVISHLHPPHDGDIIVPQRKLSIIGSTQWVAGDPDDSGSPAEDIPVLIDFARAMIPAFAEAPFHAAWTAARPLAGFAEEGDGRELSRDFLCIDHQERDGVDGMFTVLGGKATVLRAMAERTVDLLCARIGRELPCTTADEVLPPYRAYFQGGDE